MSPVAPERGAQLSFIEGMERPIGTLPPSVFHGNNADLMVAVAPMYLTGSVLDTTYGRGGWWARFTPEPFVHHDKDIDGVDFRSLPYANASWDTVCFDPPYVLSGGAASSGAEDLRDRFGLEVGFSNNTLEALILDGLTEVCRVAKDCILVKCMEFAQGGKFHDIPTMVKNRALECGWFTHDVIVHAAGTGPGGWNITTVKRARRAHSYLLVFAKERT